MPKFYGLQPKLCLEKVYSLPNLFSFSVTESSKKTENNETNLLSLNKCYQPIPSLTKKIKMIELRKTSDKREELLEQKIKVVAHETSF